MNDIVTDRTVLKMPCEAVDSIEEGLQIAETLIQKLEEQTNAIGIAANQVGICKQVCIVRVDRTIILINPRIVRQAGEVLYREGCLSFPQEEVETKRFFSISVQADNYEEIQDFVPHDARSLLECICIQHEIDHLRGITMHDRAMGGK